MFKTERLTPSLLALEYPRVVHTLSTTTQHGWSDEDVARLRKLYFDGISFREIAERIGRTHKAVAQKVYWMSKRGIVP